jgi:hypothetical protein
MTSHPITWRRSTSRSVVLTKSLARRSKPSRVRGTRQPHPVRRSAVSIWGATMGQLIGARHDAGAIRHLPHDLVAREPLEDQIPDVSVNRIEGGIEFNSCHSASAFWLGNTSFNCSSHRLHPWWCGQPLNTRDPFKGGCHESLAFSKAR